MPEEIINNAGDVLRHELQDQAWSPSVVCDTRQSELIEQHVEQYIGNIAAVFHEIISDTLHLDLLLVHPTEERPWNTLITMGMSALPMNTPSEMFEQRYAELMISLPAAWPMTEESFKDDRNYWPLYWLKTLARMPSQYDTWLGFGHSVPNGDPPMPLADNTALSGIVLSPPLEREGFAQLDIDGKRTVYFWNLVPIYREEMDFKLKHDAGALFDRFANAGVSEIIDINRKNVCKRKWFGLF